MSACVRMQTSARGAVVEMDILAISQSGHCCTELDSLSSFYPAKEVAYGL
jgi:hypothetical protein